MSVEQPSAIQFLTPEQAWDKAMEVAAGLVEPKPLKGDADSFDRLAHTISSNDAKAIRKLTGAYHFAGLAKPAAA